MCPAALVVPRAPSSAACVPTACTFFVVFGGNMLNARLLPAATAALLLLVAACATQSRHAAKPVTLESQLDCALNIAFAAGYSLTLGWESRMSPDCVVMENVDRSLLTVCTSVRNDTVSVRAGLMSSTQGTKVLSLQSRIASSCPPRPLRK